MEMTYVEEILNYNNPRLRRLIEKELRLSPDQATDVFNTMLQFLCLAAIDNGALAPSESIDAAWRLFIRQTRAYRRFCRRHFGKFLAYVPAAEEKGESVFERVLQAAYKAFG